MSTLFLICALVGGTVMVCQFVMTIAGLGGHGLELSDAGAPDVPHDFGHDFGHDLAGHDAHGGDAQDQDSSDQHQSTWLFGMLTLRTLIAAVTFFGVAGKAAESADLSLPNQLLIALVCGVAAMCLVHWLMRVFYRLSEDSTVRINRAVGQEGTVYISIPADKAGAGKITLNLQGRLMEYLAVTSSHASLPTGARVVVVGVAGSSTLEVEPQQEPVAVEPRI
jgi:membrane protein implicated in regulation of membrane protease activity